MRRRPISSYRNGGPRSLPRDGVSLLSYRGNRMELGPAADISRATCTGHQAALWSDEAIPQIMSFNLHFSVFFVQVRAARK